MSNKEPSAKKTSVHCRRVNASKSVEEHADCPYCFGKATEIESEEHARFCSFDPEVDPVVYGFPPGTTRSR